MKRENKIYLLLFLSIVFIAIFMYSFGKNIKLSDLKSDVNEINGNVNAYHDWSDMKSLSSEYSYSTILLTEKTEFKIYRNKDGKTKEYTCDLNKFIDKEAYYLYEENLSDTNDNGYKFYIKWGKYDNTNICRPEEVGIDLNEREISDDLRLDNGYDILIKNSVLDKDGNYVDAVLSTSDIYFLKGNKTTNNKKSYISVRAFYCIEKNNYATLGCTNEERVTYGSPLVFALNHSWGSVNSQLKYYEPNTYRTESEKIANISKLNALFSDIDIYNKASTSGNFDMLKFKGNEGMDFYNHNTSIYYDTTGTRGLKKEDGNDIPLGLSHDGTQTGIYANVYNENYNTNNMHPRSSVFITADISDYNSFNFGYEAGNGVGIDFQFVSPYKYDISAPIKTASVQKTTDNKTYIYHITQHVSNNYYGNKLKFIDNIKSLYDSISISDTFDEKLTNIQTNNITVTNDSGVEVTNYFDIAVSENNGQTTVSATISNNGDNSFITQPGFYNRSYTLNVPVTTKDKINKNKISNKASTIVDDDTNNILESNNVDVDVYYTVIVNHIDEYNNKILKTTTDEVIYGNTFNSDKENFENYEYDYYESDADDGSKSGIVNRNITVNYYYKRNAKIIVNYLEDGTNNELISQTIINKKYKDNFDVTNYKNNNNIPSTYEYTRYTSDAENALSGIVKQDIITVNYYYALKESTITIKYLEETTNKELAETYTKSMKYTEVYNATEIRDKAGVPKNYNLVRHESSTGVLSGTISEPSILIIFYYEKKDPKLETSVSKTGTKEITRKDAEVGYKLNYKAVIKDYIGEAKVTYTDKLPYEIDEEKSDISGGKYNKETKTIIWEETYEKIDMEKEITFTKEIKVVYTGIEDTDRIMTNEIETTIKLENKENTVTSDYDTDIKIPGEIVIHYYDKETKEKLAKDIEKTDLIGNQYVSEEKEFEGYKLVSKPESNVHIYKEKKQEFSYEYEKIKFKITTKVEGEGGTIEGDEIVKYGEDSSKDKIKIKAKEGYEINKITINGESYEITDRNEIIMPYFKEVKEDKEVIVSFVKKIENPKTLDNIMSYIGYAVLSIIGLVVSGIVLIKNKTQEKI